MANKVQSSTNLSDEQQGHSSVPAPVEHPKLGARRYADTKQPTQTLDGIRRLLSEPRRVPLLITENNQRYVQWRFDGVTLLYNTLKKIPRPSDVSKDDWQRQLQSRTKQLRKQHPIIADLPDVLVKHAIAFAASRWNLSLKLRYGSNVRMLHENGRNYAFSFPDQLGVVRFGPSGNAGFDSFMVNTLFVLKVVDVRLDLENNKPLYAVFRYLDVDVVGIANRLLKETGGVKLPTESLIAAIREEFKAEIHDRDIKQFMDGATGWRGPKRLKVFDANNMRRQVRGYERYI